VEEGYKFEKSFVLDYDRSNLENRHVIIPFNKLIKILLMLTLCVNNAAASNLHSKGKCKALQQASTGSMYHVGLEG
jgi:hypothetical protein